MKTIPHLICRITLYVFFAVYMFLLLYVLIFSRLFFGEAQYVERSINLIPFNGVFFDYRHNFWNIMMFVPLGLYLPAIPLFNEGKKAIDYLRWIFLFSLLAEVLQWVLGVGSSDINDIILNCAGGFVGISIYKILLSLLKKESRVQVFVAVSSAVGIPVSLIAIGTVLANL